MRALAIGIALFLSVSSYGSETSTIQPNISLFRFFKSVKIPGAYCGKGQPYKVFLHRESSRKLAIEFMGGGACWDEGSCHGLIDKRTVLSLLPIPLPNVHQGLFSPMNDHTYLYFPYCTGDVFSGSHVANYGGKTVNHFGRSNVEKALSYLGEQGLIDYSRVEQLTVHGSSAGAIGALVNAKLIESYFPSYIDKVLIADSPGLHFGPSFWHKFSDQWLTDIQGLLDEVDMKIDRKDGVLADQIYKACHSLRDWRIGVIQSTMDVVMSAAFGNIDPLDHRDLVFGPRGLRSSLKKADNCDYWIPDSPTHAFLIQPSIEMVSWVTAFQFSNYFFYYDEVGSYSPLDN